MFYYPKRQRVYAPVDDEQVTKQSHKDECDIYKILKQYQRTGVLTHITQQEPRFADLPSDVDYQSALNSVIAAEQAFNALPGAVRDEYGNDPSRFLAAFADDKQHDRLRELGLLKPKPKPEPAPAPAPAPAPEPSKTP